jgi:hypothetical protein
MPPNQYVVRGTTLFDVCMEVGIGIEEFERERDTKNMYRGYSACLARSKVYTLLRSKGWSVRGIALLCGVSRTTVSRTLEEGVTRHPGYPSHHPHRSQPP